MTMRRTTNDKLWTLAVAAGFFAAGVVAVSLEHGPLRSTLLTLAFAGLLAIALRQTLRRMRASEGCDNEGCDNKGRDNEVPGNDNIRGAGACEKGESETAGPETAGPEPGEPADEPRDKTR